MARATLIVTAHNLERFIGGAVRSVLAQSERDISIIIVDDGSTDGSLGEIKRAIDGDPRVRLIEGPNRGFTRVLAETIALVDTPYFGWVDGDDLLEHDAVRACADALDANPAASFAYTLHTLINERGEPLAAAGRAVIPYSPQRLLVDFMTFHFRLIRTSAYERVGGIDLSFATAQDYDLCLKLSEIGQVLHIPRPLYRYRLHLAMVSTQRRVEQIESSRRAIENALRRRGMEKSHRLDVEIIGRFILSPRGE